MRIRYDLSNRTFPNVDLEQLYCLILNTVHVIQIKTPTKFELYCKLFLYFGLSFLFLF